MSNAPLPSDPLLDDDSPSVIGARPVPMPTEAEFRAVYKAAYVARMVERGIDAEDASACFEAGDFNDIRHEPPAEAADDEISYWDNDE